MSSNIYRAKRSLHTALFGKKPKALTRVEVVPNVPGNRKDRGKLSTGYARLLFNERAWKSDRFHSKGVVSRCSGSVDSSSISGEHSNS